MYLCFVELRTEENFQQFLEKSIHLKLGGGKNQTVHTVENHYRINIYFTISVF